MGGRDSAMCDFSLVDLKRIIEERVGSTTASSYTKTLLDGGIERVTKKFGEEAVEIVIAAMGAKRNEIIAEAADVLYHLLVLLQCSQVELNEVMAELHRRTQQSGHQEKANRSK